MTVTALFVDDSDRGVYPRLLGSDVCYGETHGRDARTYAGPDPVVAHPPCNLWVNMAAQNYARAKRPCPKCLGVNDWGKRTNSCDRCHGTGRREPNRAVVFPAWYPRGDDGGRFAAALRAVRTYGGVLEHPASTHAWAHHGLPAPWKQGQWHHWYDTRTDPWTDLGYVTEIWQSAYGARMRKRTWLLYCGKRPPFDLDWRREPGTHQVGWFDRVKPTVGKREASATPERLARELVRLAEWS